jgi:hypothetical protein
MPSTSKQSAGPENGSLWLVRGSEIQEGEGVRIKISKT